jgi:precorrin-6B methylase 2
MNVELSCAPYVPSPHEVVRKMLELAHAGPDDVLVDLGCGDGRILVSAIREFNVRKAVGYELREDLYKLGLQEIERQRLWDRAKIVFGDLFNADLSEATVITLYLTGTANDRLKPKLRADTRPGARIVSHDFSINGWRTLQRESFEYHTIYMYQIPHAYEIENQLP